MISLQLMTAYRAELERGYSSLAHGELAAAFQCFERAHILGQRSTRLHVRAHVAMLKVGWLTWQSEAARPKCWVSATATR